jgi:hypothetical protein
MRIDTFIICAGVIPDTAGFPTFFVLRRIPYQHQRPRLKALGMPARRCGWACARAQEAVMAQLRTRRVM